MGAFTGLSQYFYHGIVNKAIELNYSEPNILILQGEETLFRKKFPHMWTTIESCGHHRDNRTPFEYARDLVASWVFEDCVIGSLRDSGLEITHGGSDKCRNILPDDMVTSNSDAMLILDNKSIPIEIMCDYTGFWTNKGKIDLRDNKYQKLSDTQSIFMGFSTTDNKMILLDFDSELNVEYIASHRPYGNKPAYSILIENSAIQPFTTTEMVNTIKNMYNKRKIGKF